MSQITAPSAILGNTTSALNPGYMPPMPSGQQQAGQDRDAPMTPGAAVQAPYIPEIPYNAWHAKPNGKCCLTCRQDSRLPGSGYCRR